MSDPGLSDLVTEIKKSDTPEMGLRLATVDSIQATTVSIRVAGSTTITSGVDYVKYAPVVNQTVLVFQNGNNLIIWGIPGSTSSVPPGVIEMFGSATPPAGYLLCNGQVTTGYAALATIVGANVPDLRDRFITGAGLAYASGATGGANTVNADLLNHFHTQPSHNHAGFNHTHTGGLHAHAQVVTDGTGGPGTRNDYNTDNSGNVYPQGVSTDSAGAVATTSDGGAYVTGTAGNENTAAQGAGGGHENRPPYYALTFIIKT